MSFSYLDYKPSLIKKLQKIIDADQSDLYWGSQIQGFLTDDEIVNSLLDQNETNDSSTVYSMKVSFSVEWFVPSFLDSWIKNKFKIHPILYQYAQQYAIDKISKNQKFDSIEKYFLASIYNSYQQINQKQKIQELDLEFEQFNRKIKLNKFQNIDLIINYLQYELCLNFEWYQLIYQIVNKALENGIAPRSKLVILVSASLYLADEMIKKKLAFEQQAVDSAPSIIKQSLSLKTMKQLFGVSENNIRLCYYKLYPRRFLLVPESEQWFKSQKPNQVSVISMSNYFNKSCSYILNLVSVNKSNLEMPRLWKEVISFSEIWDILKLKQVNKNLYKLLQDPEIWRRIIQRDFSQLIKHTDDLKHLVNLYGMHFINTCQECKTQQGKQRISYKVYNKLHLYCLRCNYKNITLKSYVESKLLQKCKKLYKVAWDSFDDMHNITFTDSVQWQVYSQYDVPKIHFCVIMSQLKLVIGQRINHLINEFGLELLKQHFYSLSVFNYFKIEPGFKFKWQVKPKEFRNVEVYYILYVVFEQQKGLDYLRYHIITNCQKKRRRCNSHQEVVMKRPKLGF